MSKTSISPQKWRFLKEISTTPAGGKPNLSEYSSIFYIHFLTGPFAGEDLTEHLSLGERLASHKSAFWYFVTEYRPGDRQTYLMPFTPTVFFGTYEAAVDFEVEFVEFLRVLGYTMDA